MKLQELQSKINTISLGDNPHSPLNTQKLEELFTDKRKILCEKENGIGFDDKKSHHNNKYE